MNRYKVIFNCELQFEFEAVDSRDAQLIADTYFKQVIPSDYVKSRKIKGVIIIDNNDRSKA